MEPNSNQDQNNQALTTPTPKVGVETQPEPEPKPETLEKTLKQPRKTLIILTVIFAVLAVVGISFGIWGVINVNQKPKPTPVTLSEPEPAVNEEVELTDTYIIKDLDEKLAVLHHTNLLDSPMIARAYRDGGNYDMIYELYNGTLSERAKIFATYLYLKDQFEYPTADIENTFITKYPDSYNESDFQGTESSKVIDANSFVSGYHAIFGKDLNLSSITDTTPCPHLRYDEDLGLIITDARCGGTGPNLSYFYKNRYTTNYDQAYVYIDALEIFENDIYCGIPSSYEDASLKCGTATPTDQVENIDVSPYRENAGKYRFVFTKATDGTYYFEKVEKISN